MIVVIVGLAVGALFATQPTTSTATEARFDSARAGQLAIEQVLTFQLLGKADSVLTFQITNHSDDGIRAFRGRLLARNLFGDLLQGFLLESLDSIGGEASRSLRFAFSPRLVDASVRERLGRLKETEIELDWHPSDLVLESGAVLVASPAEMTGLLPFTSAVRLNPIP